MLSRASVLAALPFSRQQATYALTIGVLLLILGMGHHTHWNLVPAHGPTAQAHVPTAAGAWEPEQSRSAGAASGHSGEVLAATDAALEKAGVELGRVERRGMSASLAASGVVAYNHNLRAELATRVPGNVWRIEKRVGETIRKGDVLAIIESTDVGRAKGELLQAIVQSELKAINYERLKQLGGGVAERSVREAEAAARQARIQVQVCVQALVNLGLPVSLDELHSLSDEERARRIQFIGLPEPIVASLDPRTTTANLLPLVAPFDGVVIGRGMAMGEVVHPNQPHFEIADIRKLWVVLEVRKEDANQVRLGQPVCFSPDGYDGQIRGVIDWVSTAVDEKTRTLQVRAEVDNPAGADSTEAHRCYLLRAHTYGAGRVTIRDTPDALVVPAEAVQIEAGAAHVYVRDGSRFRRVPVQIGARDDRYVEITSGLEEGMVVATAGSHVLKAHMQLLAATR
jgi:membrane fusion protein, heavy metal efflux system